MSAAATPATPQAVLLTARRAPPWAQQHPLRVSMAAAVLDRIALFLAAALAEIGGGYLVWRWLRAGAAWWFAPLGAAVLFAYGVLPTLQPAGDFGRIYAAYGGVFVAAALFWGWGVDGVRPDVFDWVGGSIAVAGAAVMFFAPRGASSGTAPSLSLSPGPPPPPP